MQHITYIKWALNCLEIMAAIAGLLYYKKFLPNKGPFYFAIYLCFISILELIGKYFAHNMMQDENYFLYEWIATPLQFIAISGIYCFFVTNKTSKVIVINIALYLLVAYGLQLYFKKDTIFKNYTFTIGLLFYIINSLIYFYSKSNKSTIVNYKQQYMFWVVMGSLIYYLLTYPFFAFKNTIYKVNSNLYMVLYYFNFICAYLMYIFFIIAYKCSKPNS
jgi:hypothetical protein